MVMKKWLKWLCKNGYNGYITITITNHKGSITITITNHYVSKIMVISNSAEKQFVGQTSEYNQFIQFNRQCKLE